MKKGPAIAVVFAAMLSLGPTAARAQASGANPDISVIPQFLICPQGAEDCPYADADGKLNLQEVELALQGYLNPYVRGDVFVSANTHGVEVEEAYASFVRGLGRFQARIGKYRVDWGTINPLHPHAYSWIFQPLVEERLFGPEGLNQIALNGNMSFAAGERAELIVSANFLRGDIGPEEHGSGEPVPSTRGTICVGPGCADGVCEPGDADCALVYYDPQVPPESETNPEPAYHVRVSYFNQLGPSHSLLVGASGLRGTVDPGLDRKVDWYGADFKYRFRPNKYRSLNVIGSYVRSEVDLEAKKITGTVCVGPDCAGDLCPAGGVCQEFDNTVPIKGDSLATDGWYLLADWQFAQRWNGGAKFDWSEGLETRNAVQRAEVFLDFRLMEETTLFRLLFRREDGDEYASARNTAAIQFLFSLGPHRPHTF